MSMNASVSDNPQTPVPGGQQRARVSSRARRLFVLMALLAGTCPAPAALASELDVGAKAPNFTLKSVRGENLRLGEYAGDVRAILFTASWCGTCSDALRNLQTLTPQMKPFGFQAWAIALDQDAAETRKLAQHLNLGYPMLIDNEGRVAKLFWIDDLPALFLLDRDGRIRDVLEGDAVKNTARIADTLKRIAEE